MQISVLSAKDITVSKLFHLCHNKPIRANKISSGGFYYIKKNSSYLHRLDEDNNKKIINITYKSIWLFQIGLPLQPLIKHNIKS